MKTLTAHPFKSLFSVGAGGALGAGIATLVKQDQKIPAVIGALLGLGGYYVYQRRKDKAEEEAAALAAETDFTTLVSTDPSSYVRAPIDFSTPLRDSLERVSFSDLQPAISNIT